MARQHPDEQRLRKEAALMAQHTRARLVKSSTGAFYWLERLRSEGGRWYTLTIEYPPRFPHQRPKAFFINPPIQRGPHMLSDGSLCLFDDPGAADPRCTALVVRNRAVTWLLAYEAWQLTGGEWRAPQHGAT